MAETYPAWMFKPAINPLPHWYEVRGGAWRVPAAVVEEMAKRIKTEGGAFVRDTYIIQYQGVSAGGAESVRLKGACSLNATNERELSERFHQVLGGGKCYFDAAYDPAAKRFTSLTFNSPR